MKNHPIKYILYVLLFLLLLGISILAYNNIQHAHEQCQLLISTAGPNIPASTTQVLLVKSLGSFKTEIIACQLQGNRWQSAFKSGFQGVIGRLGLAGLGEKKEGDKKTPRGFYPIGEVFGSTPVAVKMDFKYITAEDKFVDDETSPSYNQWVRGPTDAKSCESMLINFYQLGAIVKYNMEPIIPGKGSAIFIHKWQSFEKGTSGCIAMDGKHLATIIHWFDKKNHPYIYITH